MRGTPVTEIAAQLALKSTRAVYYRLEQIYDPKIRAILEP